MIRAMGPEVRDKGQTPKGLHEKLFVLPFTYLSESPRRPDRKPDVATLDIY